MIALLGLGLLAVLLLVGRRECRAYRRRMEYEARLAERRVRFYEDEYWSYRQTEAELAVALWRRSWPGHVAGATNAARSLSEAFRAFSVPVKEASARLARLNALLASDRERMV